MYHLARHLVLLVPDFSLPLKDTEEHIANFRHIPRKTSAVGPCDPGLVFLPLGPPALRNSYQEDHGTQARHLLLPEVPAQEVLIVPEPERRVLVPHQGCKRSYP